MAGSDDWIAPVRRRRARKRKPAAAPSATREWLPTGRGRALTKGGNRGNGRSLAARRVNPPRLLHGNGRELEAAERHNRTLEQRVATLEEELRAEREKSRKRIAKLRAELKEGPALPNGKLDANAATFEQLRAVGLSITQSAKLIARREQNGGFQSRAALLRTPGLSGRARELIRERLRVGRG